MTLCIYHGNCADGFAAAWVVRRAIPDAVFHAGTYNYSPPDVAGQDVVIVDFSYKRPVLVKMAERAKSILILDHHVTAQEDLVALPENVTTVFDMNRSGCMIAWNHFFPHTQPPKLLFHIQDRDLWRFKYVATRAVMAALFSYEYDFEVWDKLIVGTSIRKLRNEGKVLERKHLKDVKQLLRATQREMVIGGHRVPVANLPSMMASDAGHIMSLGKPFAACYWDSPDGRVFSLRSHSDGEDVSAIAKAYGGGGHRNAAGFTVTREEALKMERSA